MDADEELREHDADRDIKVVKRSGKLVRIEKSLWQGRKSDLSMQANCLFVHPESRAKISIVRREIELVIDAPPFKYAVHFHLSNPCDIYIKVEFRIVDKSSFRYIELLDRLQSLLAVKNGVYAVIKNYV